MGNHYGTVVVPARPRHPKDKSSVEGSVRLVYMRVFAELRNETFRSLEELNAAAADKMRKHNQKRMQKKPVHARGAFPRRGQAQPQAAAAAILDRLVHTSIRFELKGASLCQKRMSNSTESENDD